jgi:hypothetical protein
MTQTTCTKERQKAGETGRERQRADETGDRSAWRAHMDIGPVWDVRIDLGRLRGIVGALAYLTSPAHLREDDDFEVFHESFMEIMERLDAAEQQLSSAIETMKFNQATA